MPVDSCAKTKMLLAMTNIIVPTIRLATGLRPRWLEVEAAKVEVVVSMKTIVPELRELVIGHDADSLLPLRDEINRPAYP